MVCNINTVKTDDSFHSFVIHVMIMQALSDVVLLNSVRQEVMTNVITTFKCASEIYKSLNGLNLSRYNDL